MHRTVGWLLIILTLTAPTGGGKVTAAEIMTPLERRAYGKAPTFSSTDTTQFKRAIDMTDDELAAIASRATLHVIK